MSLRPQIHETCRAVLRDPDSTEAAGHVASCSFCSARLAAPAALGAFVAARPPVPAELASKAMLEGVYERAVEMAEQGPVAEWLDAAPAPQQVEAPQWEDSLMDSEIARELVRRPESPSAEAWSDVRRTILDEVSAGSVARSQKPRRWPLLLAGAAAAAVLGMITVSEGTKEEAPIVFMELGEAPDIPFVHARRGGRN